MMITIFFVGLFVALGFLFAMVKDRSHHVFSHAWLVVISRSFFVVWGLLHPSLCTKVSLMVPEMKEIITSMSARLDNSLHYREKH